MHILSGHLLQEVLYESSQTRIYCGTRLFDGLPIIVKILNQLHPSTERRARFEQEYHLMQRLQLNAIAKAYSLENDNGQLAIVMEDFGGQSLNKLDIAGKLPLDEWLRLAIHITQRLGQLHARHVMHKDINPSNIVWNRETNQLKLIDLGIATELLREVAELRSPDWLEGTLAYISPEQTGRMNRAIDYRTDFYSLGVTLYELLTGQLPFVADDALQLMHAHIARQHTPVKHIRPDIPEAVSAIIDKLLSKTAEQRYQSSSGLVADLRTCLQTLDDHGQIPIFELGSRDFSLRLQIPQKLYGRDNQVATLLDAFGRAAQGSAELLLVAGHAGVGKSALVHEVQKPITRHRGYFIEGKFDQFERDIPYRAFTQAFSTLIRQILTERNAVIQGWKEGLLVALGNNAQVIIDVIPDLALLIGQQPAVPELPPEQARNRFNHELRKFIAAFATADHPLVIFIDDLQWADMPSLELLSLLLRTPSLPHLLLIGAYRNNEVAPGHALSIVLEDMQKQGAVTHTITLEPLGLGDVNQLLVDTLHVDARQTKELTQLCLAKTGGNPFFLNQFLMTLADRDMLLPNAASGSWHWDIERIREADITDNVVELMISKLRQLSEPTQRVLQGAACLGNVFDLHTLATVCKQPDADTAQLLWPALMEELIVPLDEHYKYAGQVFEGKTGQPWVAQEQATATNPRYRFLHDRVHQAASLLSSNAETAAMHLAIGRLWLDTYSQEQQAELLFDLVNHLNQGCSLISNPQERYRLAELNLQAGRKAKVSTAYKSALIYLQTALELVNEKDWQRQYDLMFALHLEGAEAACLSSDFAQMQRYIDMALPHTTEVLDQAKLHEIHIMACIAQSKLQEAITIGLETIRLFGISFPKRPRKLHVLIGFARTKWVLRGKSIDDLAKIPNMTDAHIIAANRIMARITPAAYDSVPEYVPIFIFKVVQLVLKYGYAPTSPPGWAVYGLALSNMIGDIAQGTRYGELVLRLQQRPEMWGSECRALVVTYHAIFPWSRQLTDTLDPLARAFHVGLEVGDPEFSGKAALFHCEHAFYCGYELFELERKIGNYYSAMENTQGPPAYSLKILRQTVLNLMDSRQNSSAAQDALIDGKQMQDVQPMQDDRFSLSLFFGMALCLCYLFRNYRLAFENAIRAEQHAGSRFGCFSTSIVNFYDSLTRLALADGASAAERRNILHTVKKNQKKMRHWADHAPANFLHKWHLVEAELARVTGEALKAIDCYEQAIALATEYKFVQEQALAQELAGQFHLARGQQSLARFHLREAWQSYRRWGAMAKVRDLENRHSWLIERKDAPLATTSTNITSTSSTTANGGALDLAAVLKASHVLSQEIMLDKLLSRLMDLANEHAGAQRGMLLLKKKDNWYIEAQKSQDQEQAVVLQSIMLDESQPDSLPLPLSLLLYVSHTRESVMIHDARHDLMTAGDSYVQRHGARSLLLVPVLHQAELIGMLYLENNAASSAFTEARLQMLQLLASQAAISIGNAKLYADMEQRARAAELRAMSLQDLTAEITDDRH